MVTKVKTLTEKVEFFKNFIFFISFFFSKFDIFSSVSEIPRATPGTTSASFLYSKFYVM